MYASISCRDLVHTNQDRAVLDHLGTLDHLVKTEAGPNGDFSYHLGTQPFPSKNNYFLTYCQACCWSSLHLLRFFLEFIWDSCVCVCVGRGGGEGGGGRERDIKVFSSSSNKIVFGVIFS